MHVVCKFLWLYIWLYIWWTKINRYYLISIAVVGYPQSGYLSKITIEEVRIRSIIALNYSMRVVHVLGSVFCQYHLNVGSSTLPLLHVNVPWHLADLELTFLPFLCRQRARGLPLLNYGERKITTQVILVFQLQGIHTARFVYKELICISWRG